MQMILPNSARCPLFVGKFFQGPDVLARFSIFCPKKGTVARNPYQQRLETVEPFLYPVIKVLLTYKKIIIFKS